MISSYRDFERFVDNAKLTWSLTADCSFLQDDNNSFSPQGFKAAVMWRKEKNAPAPVWIKDHLLQIISLFGQKDAYGSVFALVMFYKKHVPHAERELSEIILTDHESASPVLQEKDINFLLLAAMYTDSIKLASFLLGTCHADVNYQAPDKKISVLDYGLKYASHSTLQKLLKYAIKDNSLNLAQVNRYGHDPLFIATNYLRFDLAKRNATSQEKVAEIVFLLENGACCIRAQNNPIEETLRVTPENTELFLQYGAGLVKLEFRSGPAGKEDGELPKTIRGFDYQQICTADAVLVATCTNTNQPVWLYGMDAIKQALRDETVKINVTEIRKQLALVTDPSILAEGVLQLFTPMPRLANILAENPPARANSNSFSTDEETVIINTPTNEAQENTPEEQRQEASSNRCVIS